MRKSLLFLAVPLLLSNCLLLSGRCVYELRGVNTAGSFIENGTEIAYAELIEDEQRDSEPDKNMSWQIRGPSLKGHVTKIVLRDNSKVYYDFPIADPAIPMLSNGFVRQSEGANLNGFYDLLGSNRAMIVITTDLPGRQTITITLLTTYKSDWNRPYCS